MITLLLLLLGTLLWQPPGAPPPVRAPNPVLQNLASINPGVAMLLGQSFSGNSIQDKKQRELYVY